MYEIGKLEFENGIARSAFGKYEIHSYMKDVVRNKRYRVLFNGNPIDVVDSTLTEEEAKNKADADNRRRLEPGLEKVECSVCKQREERDKKEQEKHQKDFDEYIEKEKKL